MATPSQPDPTGPTDPTDPSALPEILGDLVQADARLVRIAARELGNTESPAVWRTIGVLIEQGPMRLGALAHETRVAQPTMTRLLDAMAGRGYVDRVADPEDARALRIELRPEGRDAYEAWRRQIGAALAARFGSVDADDLAALQRTVGLLRAAIDPPSA